MRTDFRFGEGSETGPVWLWTTYLDLLIEDFLIVAEVTMIDGVELLRLLSSDIWAVVVAADCGVLARDILIAERRERTDDRELERRIPAYSPGMMEEAAF